MIIRPETQATGINPLRLKRGTKVADIPSGPPPSFSDIDSSFHMAEYLALKVKHDPHDIEGLVNLPESAESPGTRKSRGSRRRDEEDEKYLWLYEHLRRIPIDLTPLVVLLLQSCTAESCPKMRADEWQYLCVAHGREGAEECSAIDYILHTLDSTTALLTSHDAFPSRIQIRAESLAQFPSLFRRLSRIFSHAYYHHRETFHLAEAETSLYARFVALCEKYDLVGSNLLVIPRDVVADTLDGKSPEIEVEDEDEQDEDDEEDEDEDIEAEAEERDSRSRDKGESGRRPHSLDRHARPHKLQEWRPTLEATVKGKPQQLEPESEARQAQPVAAPAALDPQSAEDATAPAPSPSTSASVLKTPMTHTEPDPISLSESRTYSLKPRFPRDSDKTKQQVKNVGSRKDVGEWGRSNLGKKSRGTMLWTSDTSDPAPTKDLSSRSVSTPIAESPGSLAGATLERTNSVETAILAPSDLEGDGPVSVSPPTTEPAGGEEAEEEEVPVPKDEIELLEEEGKLESKVPVSPLAPSASLDSDPATQPTTETEATTQIISEEEPETDQAADTSMGTTEAETGMKSENPETVIESEPAAHDIVESEVTLVIDTMKTEPNAESSLTSTQDDDDQGDKADRGEIGGRKKKKGKKDKA